MEQHAVGVQAIIAEVASRAAQTLVHHRDGTQHMLTNKLTLKLMRQPAAWRASLAAGVGVLRKYLGHYTHTIFAMTRSDYMLRCRYIAPLSRQVVLTVLQEILKSYRTVRLDFLAEVCTNIVALQLLVWLLR